MTERFNEMIKDKFIDMITDTFEHLSHNDYLFKVWLIGYIRTTKGIISKEIKEQCLQFLRDKRAEQFVEEHADEIKELLAYKNSNENR